MAKITSNASSMAIKVRNPGVNYSDLSHYIQGSTNFGDITPVHVENVLPGSHHRISYEHLIRLLPLQAPAIQDIYVEFRTFFCRNDILWKNWRSFITGGDQSVAVPTQYPIPQMEIMTNPDFNAGIPTYFGPKSLTYHLGWRPQLPKPEDMDDGLIVRLNPLRHMAYQKIWWEYLRDANNTTVPSVNSGMYFGENRSLPDGVFNVWGTSYPEENLYADLLVMRSACWKHDYFTDCLPQAQRGNAVQIPTGSIDDLSKATRLQRLAQLSNRVGGRYRELLRGEYGVIPSDDSLDIPQFLGGSTHRITVGEVLQTSQTGDTPLGELGGHGIEIGSSKPIQFRSDHHGVLMTVMFIRPGSSYMNMMDRELLKTSRYDYGLPDLAQIGDQIVDQRELCAEMALGNHTKPLGGMPLGYQAPYEEYRQRLAHVNGELATSLQFWHQARWYNPDREDTYYPFLNRDFNVIAPRFLDTPDFYKPESQLYRIFADTNPANHHIVYELFAHYSAGQPLPAYSDPSFDFFR